MDWKGSDTACMFKYSMLNIAKHVHAVHGHALRLSTYNLLETDTCPQGTSGVGAPDGLEPLKECA